MSRDMWINLGCTVFTLAYIALCLIAGILASRYDSRPPPQPKDELSGIETFDAEYYELYQTGLWLIQHKETTPYDDL